MLMPDQAPVRLCCGERHVGVICPDGKVMCCLCFERFPREQLNVRDGHRENVCVPCAEQEDEELAKRNPKP